MRYPSQTLLYLISFSSLAFTLPNIIARQCEAFEWCLPSLPFDPVDVVIGGLTSFFGAGAAAANDLGGIINGFVKPQLPTSTDDHNSDTRVGASSDIELNAIGQNGEPNQCQDLLGQGDTNTQRCGPTTKVIVWPLSCELTARMIAMEELLRRLDSSVRTSKQPRCPNLDGVFFWTGAFTQDEIMLIRSYQDLIAAVEPNVPLEQALLKVRKDKDPFTQPSLNFISTAPDRQDSGEYAYFYQKQWATEITVFLIDAGYDYNNMEFQYTKISWLYALGVNEYPEPDDSGHGTCMVSALLGDMYGVAKGVPNLVMTKIKPELDSLLDSFRKIITRLGDWQKAGREIAGFTVIHLSTLITNSVGPQTETNLREMIKELVTYYQVVIVVAAGQNNRFKPDMNSPDGNVWLLPSTYSLDYDIITVGAVCTKPGPKFGLEFPWSHQGPAITVHAPGTGRCAVDKTWIPTGFEDTSGTSIASAYTAGLVAYFLGLPDLGPLLRQNSPNIPRAVKEYIQAKAWARNKDHPAPAIWNGLDADDTKLEWNYWIGDPNVDN